MGSAAFYPEERPVHDVTVEGFWMDELPVTVGAFRRFVKATGHVTTAEEPPDPADYPDADPALMVPGSGVFRMPPGPVSLDDVSGWWHWVPGADWRHPEGPGSTLDGRDRHPVTHVSYDDALAYAAWAGQGTADRARMGTGGTRRSRRSGLRLGRRVRSQGSHDGQHLAGPVPMGEPLRRRVRRHLAREELPAQRLRAVRHHGQRVGVDRVAVLAAFQRRPQPSLLRSPPGRLDGEPLPRLVIKGGSHLCAPNYCLRYRPAARQAETPDTSTSHIGLRCIVRA